MPPKGRSLRADGSLFLFYKGILSRIYQWEQSFPYLVGYTTGSVKGTDDKPSREKARALAKNIFLDRLDGTPSEILTIFEVYHHPSCI